MAIAQIGRGFRFRKPDPWGYGTLDRIPGYSNPVPVYSDTVAESPETSVSDLAQVSHAVELRGFRANLGKIKSRPSAPKKKPTSLGSMSISSASASSAESGARKLPSPAR